MSNSQPLIYAVDDDTSVVKALGRLLRACGMRVRAFESGEGLLSALRKSSDADCAIIDVKMPGMNGLEVQAHMNHLGIGVPIIFITAHEEEGVEEQALQAGAIGFLRKPFTDEALMALIGEALDRPCPSRSKTGRGEKAQAKEEKT